ncbi:tyrosine-protein kinase hopscotch-like [Atheta coriaria]|uniref:tyrosine-protein kinase hopscotch-like n=1 Tax=Dalotia coriaria TaxID=877792 RepID=UPI0031F3D964
MNDQRITVRVVHDSKVVYFAYTPGHTTAEDACIYLCKHLGIGTVARHLFALRDNKLLYLMPGETLQKNAVYDFRIRYKVPMIMRLKTIDCKAFDYYFHQVRLDVIGNKVLDIPFETIRTQLLGLGVTDMYRVMLEKQIPQETVLNDYKKYIPKAVLNRHSIFVKKPIKDALTKLSKQADKTFEPLYVVGAYLQEFENIAPNYPEEEYKAFIDHNGAIYNIYLRVSPFDVTNKGIKYRLESNKDEWNVICGTDEVCFISIRGDSSIEISRLNGIPFYVKFNSIMKMRSFVSLVDGYYRLSCKWNFNICKEIVTPSLQKLHKMKCHGPVGGEFSYAKLEEKRSNNHGSFILRECETKYNTCFMDVCTGENSKPKTFKLEYLSNDEFIFNDDLVKYKTISQLMAAYNNANGTIYLKECLPPSEYDNSPLLLCKITSDEKRAQDDNSVCINPKNLEVFSAHKMESTRNITIVYKGRWKQSTKTKSFIAIKMLNPEFRDQYLAQFLDLAGQWSLLRSNVIVKFHGITLRNLFSLVIEYVSLGQLDEYLRNNKKNIKSVDLMQASADLASALWYLAENDIIHGKIRCRKILVACHDEKNFNVKLSDPGVYTEYAPNEIHWIPVEFYQNLHVSYARQSHTTDVWAFATTVHEIYMQGEPIENTADAEIMKQFYISGKRLPIPKLCPPEIYSILLECWNTDPASRKRPQEIMRDFNQMLYEVYNSRQEHVYAQVKSFDTRSLESSLSMATETTSIAGTEDNHSIEDYNMSKWSLDDDNTSLILPPALNELDNNLFSPNLAHHSMFNTRKAYLSGLSYVYDLDQDYRVILQGRIGQGFYGEVYKGMLEPVLDNNKPYSEENRQVAVKKLKSSATGSGQKEFEEEIKIMKSLNHKNIVRILSALSSEEGIMMVMEFVPHGSLETYLKINKDTLHDQQLLRYASGIAEGMAYLGQMKIVHRDLAARNILVVDENHVKISDFGLARVITSEDYYILKTDRELPIKWYALESLLHGRFSSKSDVWSYGVTLAEMYLRGEDLKLPFVSQTDVPDHEQLVKALESGLRIPCPPKCPQSIYVDVIYPCWNADSHQRPTFQALHQRISELLQQY